jgi:hypothetical protein
MTTRLPVFGTLVARRQALRRQGPAPEPQLQHHSWEWRLGTGHQYWLYLLPGVTGYESISESDLLRFLSRDPGDDTPHEWPACAGTPDSWPALYVPADQLRPALEALQAYHALQPRIWEPPLPYGLQEVLQAEQEAGHWQQGEWPTYPVCADPCGPEPHVGSCCDRPEGHLGPHADFTTGSIWSGPGLQAYQQYVR